MTPTLRKTLSTLLLLLAPAAVVAAALLVGDLPDPLPRHWGADNQVDGTWGLAAFVMTAAGSSLALAVVGAALLWTARNRDLQGFAVPLLGWLGWFLSGIFAATLLASSGVDRAEDVPVPAVGMVTSLVVSSALAWLLHRLLPPVEDRAATTWATRPDGLTLAPGEKVVWVGSARSEVLARLGAGLTVVGAVLLLLEPGLGLVLALTGPVLMWTSVLTVRIDDRGVHSSWGPARWPGLTTALDQIRGVEVTKVLPGEWGGWGYRISPRGTAYIARGGPGLVLQRVGKGDLAITVDGAEDAGEVLGALVARATQR